MAKPGITVDHSTLHRWVIRQVPLLNRTFFFIFMRVGKGLILIVVKFL
ncbi:ISYps1 transposase [Erwinia tracheiphila PSU-1]|nr:ISYps1 transposase [Erwinia tracheiphila PSU-1]